LKTKDFHNNRIYRNIPLKSDLKPKKNGAMANLAPHFPDIERAMLNL
jgi:hypothetical protein